MTPDPFKRLASSARGNVKARGYEHTGQVSADEMRARFALYDNKCAYCGLDDPTKLGPDHMIPLSRGGLHIASNIVPACSRCNTHKGAQSVEVFLMLRQRPMADWEKSGTDVYWTPKDVAYLFRTGLATVYHWIEDGRINAVDVNPGPRSRWRITEAELARYIASRTTTSPDYIEANTTPPPEETT